RRISGNAQIDERIVRLKLMGDVCQRGQEHVARYHRQTAQSDQGHQGRWVCGFPWHGFLFSIRQAGQKFAQKKAPELVGGAWGTGLAALAAACSPALLPRLPSSSLIS